MRQVYLGVDLHATKTLVHRVERCADGKLVRTNGTYYTEELDRLCRTLDKDTIVCVEASTGVFEFYDRISPFVKEVIIIHPRAFQGMYLSGKKTDKVDAKQLANRLKAHIEDDDGKDDFPTVWVPPQYVRELREMFSFLELLKKEITMNKNKIRAMLRQHLIVLAEDADDIVIMEVGDFNVPESVRWMIRQTQELLKSALQTKKELEEKIRRTAVLYDAPTMKNLATIFGVSLMGVSAVLADAGCIERFKTAKRFCRYMRSAPRVEISNETIRIGSLDKAGRKTAFSYLVEGLRNIYTGNPHFQSFYDKKGTSKSKGKVRAALIRKTLTAIYYMWKNREEYRWEHDEATTRKLKEIKRIEKSIQAA